MTEYSVGEVRMLLQEIAGGPISVLQRFELFDIASTYADLREQIERAREGVTDEVSASWQRQR
jgi:hypothetical protein